MTVIYSARWVLPISSPAIENGAVAIDDSTITAVGRASEIVSAFQNSRLVELGHAAIIPGLVNAHSHLELTVMRGLLDREEHDFFAWLRKLTVARMSMTPDDLFISAAAGAIEAARAGITCVGDSSSLATQSMKALREVGLRGILYQESFGPDPRLARENVAKLRDQVAAMRVLENDLVHSGVSPHAPYTVSAPQLELISRFASDEQLPVMMHAAESQAEKLFLSQGRGAFAEGLRTRGIDWDAPGVSTIQYLEQHGVLETSPLLAHCVTVDDGDIEIIRENGAGIAHCPKSNAKLGHGRAPFAKFVAQGINVGLGSDSVASNNVCDLLEEARFATLLARLSSAGAAFTAEQALFAATLGGAKALGLDKQIGALAEGMQADLVAVGLNGAHQEPASNPAETLVFSSSARDVLKTMVAGKEIYSDGHMRGVNEVEFRTALKTVRNKIHHQE